jgi:hypothetical protein
VIRALTGEGSAPAAGVRIRRGEGLGGRVVASGEPLRVGDYLGEYADSPFLPMVEQTLMKSFHRGAAEVGAGGDRHPLCDERRPTQIPG